MTPLRIFLVVGLVALSACEPEAQPTAVPVSSAPKPKAKAAEVAPVEAVAQVDYSYNPVGKRDPFRGFMIEIPGPKGNDEPDPGNICTEPLCQFDLDELNVVAVVSGDANPLAMVEDKGNVGYVVRRNTKIGKQGGKVTQVLRDCIVVTSFVSGPDNKAQAVKQNMCVRADVRSTPPLDLSTGKVTQ